MAGTVIFISTSSPGTSVAKTVDGSTVTGWISTGTVSLNTDIFLTGTSSVSDKVSQTTQTGYGLGLGIVGEPWNFSLGGANFGDHIFAIIQVGGTAQPIASGGMGIIAADDDTVDAFGTWYVGPQAGSLAGWEYFVINPSAAFNLVTAGTAGWTTGGNPAQLSSVDGLGVRWSVVNKITGGSDNCYLQSISVGTGYRVTGSGSLFSDFSTFETTNRYGVLVARSGVLFPLGKIRIGVPSGAGNTDFTDSNFTVVWQGQTLSDGSSSAVTSTFYDFVCEKGSGTTSISLSNGTLGASSPAEIYVSFRNITSATLVNLALVRARLVDLDGAVNWNGGTITSSGTLDLGGSPTFTNVAFINPTDPVALKVDSPAELDNVSNVSFDGAGIGGRGSAAIFLSRKEGGSYDFDNITFANRVAGSTDVVLPSDASAFITINVLNNGDTPTVFQNYNNQILPGPPPGATEFADHIAGWDPQSDELFTSTPYGYKVNNAVTLEVTNLVVGSNVAIIANTGGPEPAGAVILNTVAAASTVSVGYNYQGVQPIILRVRRSQPGSTRYFPINTGGTITSTGFSLRVEQILDTIASP